MSMMSIQLFWISRFVSMAFKRTAVRSRLSPPKPQTKWSESPEIERFQDFSVAKRLFRHAVTSEKLNFSDVFDYDYANAI